MALIAAALALAGVWGGGFAQPAVAALDVPPEVFSAEFPEEEFGESIGHRGTFTFSPNGATGVVAYVYAFDQDPPSNVVQADPATGTATVSFITWTFGPHRLLVRSQDADGDLSPIRTYAFLVSRPREPLELLSRQSVSAADAGGTSDGGDKFGASSAAGDFNGDGFLDLAVGAPRDSVRRVRAGAVFVYDGGLSGIATPGRRLVQRAAHGRSQAGDRFGAALAAGDFNHDGFDDLAVGAPGETLGDARAGGAVFVFPGSASGLHTGSRLTQRAGGDRTERGDRFGSALAVGDLDGDGIADLAVGAPGDARGSAPAGGTVYVLLGSAGLRDGFLRMQEAGGGATQAADRFGSALAIGSVDGNGGDDLVVGTPGEHPDDRGAVYVLTGPGYDSGFSLTQGDAGEGAEADDRFGFAVAVGDFNGSGPDGVAVGSPGDRSGTGPRGGLVYVFGSASGTLTGRVLTQTAGGEASEAGDRFGANLATGDLDGDGFADLLAGMPGESLGARRASGGVLLFAGASTGLRTARLMTARELGGAPDSGDRLGSSTTIADLDANARPELVIGAPGASGGGVAHSLAGLVTALVRGPQVEAVTDHSATISAQGNRFARVLVQYRPAGTDIWSMSFAEFFDPSRDFTATITIDGLTPATTYEYRLVVDAFAAELTLATLTTSPSPTSGAAG